MIFLEIDGRLITKEAPFSIDWNSLSKISKEIGEIKEKMIIGHGSGSFGIPIKEYENVLIGFPRIRESLKRLNLAFVSSLIANGVSAISFSPASFILLKNGKVESIYLEQIKEALEKSFLPVIHEDAILDKEIGFCVLSVGKIFLKLLEYIKPKKILIASNSEVWIEGKKVKEINDGNFSEIFEKAKEKEKVKEAAMLSCAGGLEVSIFKWEKGKIRKAIEESYGTKVRIRNMEILKDVNLFS